MVLRTPTDAPEAVPLEGIAVTRGAPDATGAVPMTVALASPPVADPMAVGPYRLAVWTQWPGEEVQTLVFAAGQPFAGTWPDLGEGVVNIRVAPPAQPGDPSRPVTLRIGIVDPNDRLSGLTVVVVP
jgi:hypothetical protein